eukprot:9461756-Pyramimonas_sp.AAC.1
MTPEVVEEAQLLLTVSGREVGMPQGSYLRHAQGCSGDRLLLREPRGSGAVGSQVRPLRGSHSQGRRPAAGPPSAWRDGLTPTQAAALP